MKTKKLFMFISVSILGLFTFTSCKGHTHEYDSKYSYNEEAHWQKAMCEHTDEKQNYGSHTYGEFVVTKEATHEEDGSKKQTCSVCGYENIVVIEKLGHTYSNDWKNDATNHWHECSCGDKKDNAAHTYGEFVVTKDATHEEDGSKKQTCSVCGYENLVTIPALGHSYGTPSWAWDGYSGATATFPCENDTSHKEEVSATITSKVTKEATCEETGIRTYTATVIFGENTYTDTNTEVIQATGHTYGDFIFANAPTCENDGNVAHYQCSKCEKYFNAKKEEIDSIVIQATGHSEVIDAAVSATCESKGKTEGKHCSVCNKVLVAQQETEKLGHFIEKGICSVCGYVEPSLGLDFKLLEDGTYEIVGLGSCVKYNVLNIPDKYNGILVTSIGENAFLGSYFVDIIIPKTIKKIKADAFDNAFKNVYYNGTIEEWCNITFDKHTSNPKFYADNFYILDKNGTVEYNDTKFGLLTEVIIPNTITKIKAHSFNSFTSITSIEIPSSVTSIENDAFVGCTNLTSIEIPASVESIGDSAFYGCHRLVEVVNKSALTIEKGASSNGEIGCYALQIITDRKDSKLKTDNDFVLYEESEASTLLIRYNGDALDIEVPAKVTSIRSYAFYYCKNLTSITFQEGSKLTSIDSYAFYDCRNLTSIEIPASVESIGDAAFGYCINLRSIEIPASVTSIGVYTFYACRNLRSIEIPAGVESIGDNTFDSCENLRSITFEEGSKLTSIGLYAFYGCRNLTNIEIPANVESIGNSAFYGCFRLVEVVNHSLLEITNGSESYGHIGYYALKIITNEEKSKLYTDNDFVLYKESEDSIMLIGYNGNDTDIVIPSGVTSINSSAFYDYINLRSIEIPASVTSIGDDAFYGCYRLVEVVNHSLLEITKGSASYGYIGYYALQIITDRKDSKLYTDNDFVLYKEAEDSIILICYIGNAIDIVVPLGVTSINSYAFYDWKNLRSIEINASVTSIGDNAFEYCINLRSIEIKASVESIGDSAFEDCSKLVSITFEEGSKLTSIGNYAFRDCDSLTSIKIPAGVTRIGNYAFRNCSNLESIEIPTSVTSIGKYAFKNCSNLTSIKIPASVTSIGNYAFENCSNLESIEIPVSVESIGKDAFYDCYNLTSVYYTGTASDWANMDISDIGNSDLTDATIYYYSETEPSLNEEGTAYDDNYWHYVDGEVVVWTKL